jgi:DNA-binding response OmpR family regulator
MGKVFILEDEDSVSRGIAFTLNKSGHQIYAAASVKEAKELFREVVPDLLICDILLPDGNGLDFVKWVKSRTNTYVICLTAHDEEVDYVLGYEAGADDYVTKPFSLSVLALKVQAYFQRNSGDTARGIQTGDIRVNWQEMKVWVENREIDLTKNEWKLLQLFIRNPQQILSKKQILEQIFDIDGEFVDENTLAVNVRRLREKIEQDSAKPEYIKNIRGIGYVWNKECHTIK